jgi:two-component system, cell cycle sensor histidine kinase PleC
MELTLVNHQSGTVMATTCHAEKTGERFAARLQAKVSDAKIKAVRGRLQTGSSIEPAFEHELLSMFARNEIGAGVTMPALSIIFSLASMFWAPKSHALIWLILVILTKAWLLLQCGKFIADPSGSINIAKWRSRFFRAELFTGISWAGFVLVGIDLQTIPAFLGSTGLTHAGAALHGPSSIEFSSNVFVFATLIVVLAIRMTFAATVIPILYAGTIPMTCAVVGRLTLYNDPFYLALGAMAVGVHLYFVWLARGLNSTALDRLKYRAQKDILIAALEEEKTISEEARRRAEEASKAKSQFLATMSHELRTPLNAIMGFSEVMQAEILGPMANPTYKDYAGNIHDSGRHLLNLINEILDLSRIEAGRYELNEERIRLGDVADDCHRLLKLRAEAKGLQIIESIPDDLPLVWADQRAMRQICLNLMSNALKFTPRGGRITVTLAHGPNGGQLFSVRDTGPGIPADEIPKVLQAFGQGTLAHQTAEGGTGLGLSIVQNLVELHGGTFELKSELRKGTEVIVTLPRTRVLAAAPPLQPLGTERHRLQGLDAPMARLPAIGQRTSRPAKLRQPDQRQVGYPILARGTA